MLSLYKSTTRQTVQGVARRCLARRFIRIGYFGTHALLKIHDIDALKTSMSWRRQLGLQGQERQCKRERSYRWCFWRLEPKPRMLWFVKTPTRLQAIKRFIDGCFGEDGPRCVGIVAYINPLSPSSKVVVYIGLSMSKCKSSPNGFIWRSAFPVTDAVCFVSSINTCAVV